VSVEKIPSSSPEFPDALRDLAQPPEALWAIGDLATLRDPVVAIVGTRRPTAYGLRMTRELAGAFARAGACVVSGLANGIDAAAHRAALELGGRTVAVLGTGVDIDYPRSNRALYRAIAERGLLLSELPLGSPGLKHHFIARNRLIAALARLTIVIEAPIGSGALHTARFAHELDRDVAVVPGSIDSPQSAGSNLLMRDGAQIIASIDDALALAKLPPQKGGASNITNPVERQVWDALVSAAASLDELCARAALPVSECLSAVTGLELRGAVECGLTGEIRRR
jgi:DNA processing protein